MLNSYNPSYYTIAYHGMARKILDTYYSTITVASIQNMNNITNSYFLPYRPIEFTLITLINKSLIN